MLDNLSIAYTYISRDTIVDIKLRHRISEEWLQFNSRKKAIGLEMSDVAKKSAKRQPMLNVAIAYRVHDGDSNGD